MAKLYFRHGAVSSAKTLNLLAVAHNYKSQGKKILLMKPAMDVRFGKESIKSRAGLQQEADFLISDDTDILAMEESRHANISCILVDEAQFLAPKHIDQLRAISLLWKVPVIAYGLRTDFRANLFPGSRRLMELADTIEEVKTTCNFCNKKAVLNLKHVNGVADTQGPAVQLGAEEKYFPTCFACYRKACLEVDQLPSDAFWVDVSTNTTTITSTPTESTTMAVKEQPVSVSVSNDKIPNNSIGIVDENIPTQNNNSNSVFKSAVSSATHLPLGEQ